MITVNKGSIFTLVIFVITLVSYLPKSFGQATKGEVAHPNRAEDDVTREAMESYERGKALYNEENFEGALAEFKKAYNLKPSPIILYNIAQVLWSLHRYVEAMETLKEVLKKFVNELSPELKSTILEELQQLKERIGYLKLLVSPEGCVVKIDNKVVGQSPIEKEISLDVGEHKIEVLKEGFTPYSQTVMITAQEHKVVEINLEKKVEKREENKIGKEGGSIISESEKKVGDKEEETTKSPFYKKWWFWSIVGGVVAVGTLTGVTIYVVTSSGKVECDWCIER